MKLLNLARLAAGALALATVSACLDVDTTVPDERKIEQTEFAATLGVNLAASTKTANGAYYRDITVGTGAVVTSGMNVTVRYTGWLWNGVEFDSNTAASTPLTFQLGAGKVIPGFDEGLIGVKVGSQRQIIIPPSLGYGPYNYGPVPGNSILVFKVDVVSAQ